MFLLKLKNVAIATALSALIAIGAGTVAGQDAKDKRTAGLEALKALDLRWQKRGEEYRAACKDETDFDKVNELSKRLLPGYDPKAVEEFFEMEKSHRGTDVGVFALNLMMMRARGCGDPDTPLEAGRERAWGILLEHYLKHEDLDLLLGGVRFGPVVFGAEPLLTAAAEKSPHEHVRAAALFALASLLKDKSVSKTIMDQRVKNNDYSDTKFERWARQTDEKTLLRLADFDVEKSRREAERLAKKIMAEYPNTARPVRIGETDQPYVQQRIKFKLSLKIPTYAESAERLLFELTQLVIGQPAPSLVGQDSEGKEFRLSDCKGKVVVLVFSANWCAPCKAFYPTLRGLQKKFDGKPLQVVTVMADKDLKTVRDAIDKGDITWRAVWDGETGPIASKWNVAAFPTIYVFDERGILRARTVGESNLETIVADLVKKAK